MKSSVAATPKREDNNINLCEILIVKIVSAHLLRDKLCHSQLQQCPAVSPDH